MWSFLKKSLINFVPGRPGTEGFVPGHLLLHLSRDKGTPRQAKLFCPGTKGQRDRKTFLSRDKGTTGRPVPRDVPSLGNPNAGGQGTYTIKTNEGVHNYTFINQN